MVRVATVTAAIMVVVVVIVVVVPWAARGGGGGDGGGGDGSGGEGGGQGGASSSMTRVLGVLLPEYWKIPGKSARELPNNVSSPRMYMLAPCCMHSDLRTVGTSWGALVERSAQGSVQECKHAQRLPC